MYITLIAIDSKSSDTTSRTFSITNETLAQFKTSVGEWETEIDYRRYSLECLDIIDDYSPEIINVLDELDVTY